MVAPIQFSGLATGIDTGSMISQLVQLERLPIQRVQDKQKDLKTQQAKFNDLKNLLNTLRDKAKALDTFNEVAKSKVSAVDDTVVKATATGNAALGRFNIAITNVATAERTYSETFNSKVAQGLFGTGTLAIQVGSDAAVSINITATDTLETLASKINSSDADVTAGVIFDGSEYRLQVAGKHTGDDHAITFTETGTTIGLDSVAYAGNQLQAADDAHFTIDTIPMSSSTNTVKDAIAGVTLDLLKDSSSTSVEVTRDSEAFETAVKDFVEAYNAVQKKINGEFAFTGTAKGPDSLAGDSTLRSVQSQLRALTGAPASGVGERILSNTFNSSSGTGLFGTGSLSIQVGSASAVNVSVNGSDTLTTLAAKINSSGAGVQARVVENSNTYRLQVLSNNGSTLSIGETGTSLGLNASGNHHSAEAYTTLASIGITSQNDGTLKVDSTKLQAALADDVEAVSRVLVTDNAFGSTGLMARMQDLVKTMTDAPNGSVVARIKGIDRRVKDYDNQIDAMERRVDDYETRLTAQFTAMEQMVSGLQAQGQQMISMMGR